MEWRKFEIIMSNDKYIQNRKIVYQCSYCGTQYVNRDNCPGCGATSAASTVLADNLDTMLTTDLEQQRTEVGKNSYLIVTGVHMLFCCTLIGLTTCPLMILVISKPKVSAISLYIPFKSSGFKRLPSIRKSMLYHTLFSMFFSSASFIATFLVIILY